MLLTIQLVTLWQVGMRALDYLTTPTMPALDRIVAGPLAGLGLLLGAVVVLTGLAGRWASSVIVGHAVVGSVYLVLGWLALTDTVSPSPSWGTAGLLLSAAGVLVLVHRRAPTWARLAVAVPAMLVGQVVLAHALGADFRTGTGLLGAGALHLTLSAGTALLWQRRRLTDLVEAQVAREVCRV